MFIRKLYTLQAKSLIDFIDSCFILLCKVKWMRDVGLYFKIYFHGIDNIDVRNKLGKFGLSKLFIIDSLIEKGVFVVLYINDENES